MTLRVVVLSAAMVIVACSKGKEIDQALCGPADESITASCHLPDGTCWDLYCKSLNDNGVCFADDEQLRDRESCQKIQKGVWSAKCPCKREDSLGGCRTAKEEGRTVTKWIYSGMTVEQHRSLCESSAYNTFFAP